jgi:hypothetical protein
LSSSIFRKPLLWYLSSDWHFFSSPKGPKTMVDVRGV